MPLLRIIAIIAEKDAYASDIIEKLSQTRQSIQRSASSLSPIEQIMKGVVEALKVLGRIFGIVLGITLVLVGISFFIALLAFIFGWGGTINPFYIQFRNDSSQSYLLTTTGFDEI